MAVNQAFDRLLERGELIESPSEMTPEYLKELKHTLVVSGDTELISAPAYYLAAQRAPSINAFMTAIAIVQDELAHAHIAFHLLEELGEGQDQMVFSRDPKAFRYPYAFDVPLETWTELVVANAMYDQAGFCLLGDIHEQCSYGPWKRGLNKVMLEENFHLRNGRTWCKRIAQAGGEARDPSRTLPLAIGLAIGIVAVFYALFAGAVYHAVPWTVVRDEALRHDTSAAALLGARLPGPLRVAVVAGAAVALVKDLPPMLLGVSRLMFAWAEDGIVPRVVASIHPRFHTPQVAILLSATMASLGILGCQLAGDFFLGVDILVTSMLVNFLLMCGSVLALPGRNPALERQIRVLRSPFARRGVGISGIVLLGALLVVHTARDLGPSPLPWYLRSTVVWLGVMAVGSAVYWREVRDLERRGVNVQALFAALPPE